MKTNLKPSKKPAKLTFTHCFTNGLTVTMIAQCALIDGAVDVEVTEFRKPAAINGPSAAPDGEYELWRMACGQTIADALKQEIAYRALGFELVIRPERRRRR